MSLLSKLHDRTVVSVKQLNAVCSNECLEGNYQKAARIAQRFRNFVQDSKSFDTEEKFAGIAMAYYWLCKAGKWQINESMSKSGLYDLLLAFFAGYKLSFYYFQKILQKKIAGPFDSKHLLFTYFEDLNKMYDFMYKNYDPDIVEQADSNANDQVKLP